MMLAVVQRVKQASVSVNDESVADIGKGLLILLGVKIGDQEKDAHYLANKIANLRIFPDEAGKMNYSPLQLDLECLVVSQFTLYGDCSRGKRPDFTQAAPAYEARGLYDLFCEQLISSGLPKVQKGVFGAMMQVSLINDGPVTLLIESP
jgi:D-tyrosyl-tRNA(Tyr) deacylase